MNFEEIIRVLTRTGNETDYPGGGNGRLPVGHPEGLYIS